MFYVTFSEILKPLFQSSMRELKVILMILFHSKIKNETFLMSCNMRK